MAEINKTINVVGVVGAGQMGNGIAQVCAQSGLDVICSDVSQDALDRGKQAVQQSLARLVKKEKLTGEQAEKALSRILFTTDISQHGRSDFLVEAVSESESLKKQVLKEMDRVARPGVVLATNTSSISITRLAAVTSRPELVIGMHFMNPVPVMQLVELIRGLATTDEAFAVTRTLAERVGKTTTLSRDTPGFVANRLLMPMINEAFCTVETGIASFEDVDTTMKLGANHPMGPFALADLIGLDTCLSIMEVLHGQTGDPRYRPCVLLRQYVDAGWLGRKSGRGVFKYG